MCWKRHVAMLSRVPQARARPCREWLPRTAARQGGQAGVAPVRMLRICLRKTRGRILREEAVVRRMPRASRYAESDASKQERTLEGSGQMSNDLNDPGRKRGGRGRGEVDQAGGESLCPSVCSGQRGALDPLLFLRKRSEGQEGKGEWGR